MNEKAIALYNLTHHIHDADEAERLLPASVRDVSETAVAVALLHVADGALDGLNPPIPQALYSASHYFEAARRGGNPHRWDTMIPPALLALDVEQLADIFAMLDAAVVDDD